MRKFSLTLLILLQLGCVVANKEDSESIFTNLGLLIMRSNRLTLSGTAVKGIIKNADIKLSSLDSDGNCSTTSVITTGESDDSGNYSLTFNKTGSIVCLTVSAKANGQSTMYDETSSSDISIPGTSNFKLVSIIPEAKIQNNKKTVLVSPFSKMLSKRFQKLVQISGPNADKNALHRKASKEIVIRFGLNAGLSSAGVTSLYSVRSGGGGISDVNYPELDDIVLQLEDPTSPLTAKFTSILVGLAQLANTYKNGTNLSIDDIDAIIEAFVADFEDGVFDGQTASGNPITIGPSGNQVTFSSTPLTTILLPAITTYIQTGGQLTLGQPTIVPPPVITSTEITNQTQFVDNATISSPSVILPPTLSYTGSPYNLIQNSSISPIVPSLTGTITNCVSSPALPNGLTISATTCEITGTPINLQGSLNYTITASNSAGSVDSVIAILVNSPVPPPTALSYPLRSLPFIVGVAIGNISPSVSGSVTSYSVSPSLPAGLNLNTTTGIISGTPSAPTSSNLYTITATNAGGSTTMDVTYSVLNNHPNIYLFYKGSQDGNIAGGGGGATICSNYKNTNLPFLHCNGVRAFISLSGDDLVNAPSTNSFNGSRPVYGINASNQTTTQLSSNWSALFNLGTTPLMATFSTAMNFATGYYFTFSNANGTYNATSNCTNGTTNNSGINGFTGRSDQTGTAAIQFSDYPCYAYTMICVCY